MLSLNEPGSVFLILYAFLQSQSCLIVFFDSTSLWPHLSLLSCSSFPFALLCMLVFSGLAGWANTVLGLISSAMLNVHCNLIKLDSVLSQELQFLQTVRKNLFPCCQV
jgi:hypothetical protein